MFLASCTGGMAGAAGMSVRRFISFPSSSRITAQISLSGTLSYRQARQGRSVRRFISFPSSYRIAAQISLSGTPSCRRRSVRRAAGGPRKNLRSGLFLAPCTGGMAGAAGAGVRRAPECSRCATSLPALQFLPFLLQNRRSNIVVREHRPPSRMASCRTPFLGTRF